MKIELETGRSAKSAEMEGRLKRFMKLLDKEVKPEDVKCESKLFFKTCASFHLIIARDGVKATCSCRKRPVRRRRRKLVDQSGGIWRWR